MSNRTYAHRLVLGCIIAALVAAIGPGAVQGADSSPPAPVKAAAPAVPSPPVLPAGAAAKSPAKPAPVAAAAAPAVPAPAPAVPADDRIGPPAIDEAGSAPAAPPAPVGIAPRPAVSKSAAPGSPIGVPQAAAPKAAAPGQPAVPGRPQHFAPVLPSKDYQPPVLSIDQPRYDFGDVIKGEVVTHRFEMENKGGSPLIIQKVKPSCGCTLVDETTMDKVIAPGGKGGFELKIETSRLGVGRQQKYADVSSNDPKQSQFRVFIGGKIDSLLKVEPEQPKVQTVKGKGPGITEITLTKNITGDVKVLGSKSQSGRLLIDMKEVQPGTLWKLAVTTNYGPKETQSYYNEQIQIEVQMGERKLTQEISLPVQVKDRIEITPRSVYFKRTDFQQLKDKGTPVVKTVDLKPAVEEPYKFKITNTKLDDPDGFFKVNVETLKDGREYRLNVTVDKLPPDAPAADGKTAASKSMKGNITLTTDDPMMPEITIRCIAFF